MNSKKHILWILGWYLFALSVPYVTMALMFPERRVDDRLDAFYERAPQIQALSLGSSHTRDLHFPSMGLSGYSFADDGGDIEIAEYKLRRLVDYLPELKFVFVTVGPGFLSYSRILGVPEEFPNEYISYTPPSKSMARIELGDLTWNVRSSLLRIRTDTLRANRLAREKFRSFIRGPDEPTPSGVVECEFPDNPESHPHEDGILGGFARTPIASECLTDSFDRADAERRLRAINLGLSFDPEIADKNIEYLSKMADLLSGQGGELIIVISPTTRGFFEDLELEKLWQAERPMLEILAQRDGIRIIDRHEYFFDLDYRGANDWFSDPDHLSFGGAVVFSKALREEL